MTKKYNFRFDPEAVFGMFGGADNTREVLKALGVHISKRGIRKWRERGDVPPEAVILLHRYSEKGGFVNGNIFDLMEV